MIILVLNCGSSSIKYQVIDTHSLSDYQVLGKGQVERIGLTDGVLIHKPTGGNPYEVTQPIPDHTCGINLILEALTHPEHAVLKNISELSAIGHRVAHGGEYFKDSEVIDESVKEKIRSCFELAPLHNPAHMEGIEAMEKVLPGTPQVAVFDTSFHQTIPPENFMYALPYKYYEVDRVRRYGFHGTSHKFVAQKGCKMTGIEFNNSKIITCHLGNGASVTAILNGKSFDTSMGFTPADGLVMGTRCGSIDPGALIYIGEKEDLTYHELNELINKESGLMGITGQWSDMRDIWDASDAGNDRAHLAIKMLTNRIRKFIGAYAAEMGGVDLIIFTGGVGENDYDVRKLSCIGLEFMGVEFDTQLNDKVKSKDLILTKPNSKVKVATITTNEELVIAADTFRLTQK